MNSKRILIAGIGNIFFGDDAFGVEVVRRLAGKRLPPGVVVRDFGIRGFDLAYALPDFDAVLLVDAMRRGGTYGSLYVVEPDVQFPTADDRQEPWLQTHNLEPARVLRLAKAVSDRLPKTLLLGCEPETVEFDETGAASLSEPVQRAVAEAVDLIPSLLKKLR